jgi:hypothetical protein
VLCLLRLYCVLCLHPVHCASEMHLASLIMYAACAPITTSLSSPLVLTSHAQMDNYFLRILDSAQYKDLKATRDQITRWGLSSLGCLNQ